LLIALIPLSLQQETVSQLGARYPKKLGHHPPRQSGRWVFVFLDAYISKVHLWSWRRTLLHCEIGEEALKFYVSKGNKEFTSFPK
jgi:hypothetical protein